MKKISLDIPDELYAKLKQRALKETVKKSAFVGMNDILLPILQKEFK